MSAGRNAAAGAGSHGARFDRGRPLEHAEPGRWLDSRRDSCPTPRPTRPDGSSTLATRRQTPERRSWPAADAAVGARAERSGRLNCSADRDAELPRLAAATGWFTPLPANSSPQAVYAPAQEPRPIHLLHRGDVKSPQRVDVAGRRGMRAGPASTEFALADPDRRRQPPRRALANWIVRPEQRAARRSIVNRVWQYHFGQGIVDTPNDFGRMGGAADASGTARLAGGLSSAIMASRSSRCTG